MSWTISPIGILEGPFDEKFGVPRQSLLCKSTPGRIKLLPPFNRSEALDGLEGYSHLWLQFGFHLNQREEANLKIRPPRLGGNAKVGVFASRSSFRPNALGLSVVLYKGHLQIGGELFLEIAGHDLVSGTPIFDIKPYIAKYDSHPLATEGWSSADNFAVLEITWTQEALEDLGSAQGAEGLQQQITDLIKLHPMPTYQQNPSEERAYGMSYDQFNIRWTRSAHKISIFELKPKKSKT